MNFIKLNCIFIFPMAIHKKNKGKVNKSQTPFHFGKSTSTCCVSYKKLNVSCFQKEYVNADDLMFAL